MNITDSCPERRNFTLICLVTITYFWADGVIKNGDITIPFINIILKDGARASIIYLCIFAWFTFRYWLLFKSEPYSKETNATAEKKQKRWRKAFSSALNSATAPRWIFKYFKEKQALQERLIYENQKNRSFTISQGNFHTVFSGADVFIAYRIQTGVIEKSQLHGFKKWVTLITMMTKSFFTDPFLPTWYVPWLLFIISVYFLAHKGIQMIGLF
ncbi:hypothetical protein [Alteromonas stellipolaris]|uniref:hypothetical protein n=1 Tax=Alteromonas stellipolaris TaxID=233316 RepID=UPI0027349977|nr:hypothetical protein [Alteromonas stellipolaris]MDP2594828.1 hypothetical protein [Alteromonas stellipolaris]